MDQSYFRFLFRLARKSKQSGLSKSKKGLAKRNVSYIVIMIMIMIIIMEDFIVKASSWIKYNQAGLLASTIMLFTKAGKKTTKAKATNKMHNKVTKIQDNNLKRK